jgi:DNA invertase Pin-like site-specific DNA recombinase
MTATMIGYARCSTDEQDLTAQRQLLLGLGVAPDRIYLDHGVTGTTRNRPGLDQALAAVRAGDTLVVPKLDRLARSVPDARAIGDSLVARGVKLSLGGTVYDPSDPMRTREGMAIARAKGRLRGKQPKMSARQQAHWSSSIRAGSIRSPSWPNCSRSRGPRCIGCWNAPVAPAPACRPATLRSAAHSLPQQ